MCAIFAMSKRHEFQIALEALVEMLCPLAMFLLPVVAPRFHLANRHWMLTLVHTAQYSIGGWGLGAQVCMRVVRERGPP